MKKMEEIIGDFAERTCNTNVLFAHVFRLHFGIHGEFMPFFKRLYACGSSRVSFAIDCLGNMSDSFEPNLVEGMEELYFGADQVSIPESDDSAGRAQYYVESYVYEYEPEEPLNVPGLGENSEGDQCRGFHSSDADISRMFHHNFRHVCSLVWMPPWEAS